MVGFLARAGHLLGRLAVSFGYGGLSEAAPAKYHCFSAVVAEFYDVKLRQATGLNLQTTTAQYAARQDTTHRKQ